MNRLLLLSLVVFFAAACSKDEGERLKGQLRIITNTSTAASNDPNGRYSVTFTGLTGEDIGSEIGRFEMAYNDDTLVELNRVGEVLTVILYNVPENCSKPGEAHFDSLFNAIIVPLDGSVVETTFTVDCSD